jgi:glyoxylase-like metal-dependent hydrolase (beta-lactamase superfamily II)
MDVRVISIGTLASHPLWDERPGMAARTGHATTTLVRSGRRTILVDPGLPGEAIAAHLFERTGLRPHQVTHVFLTAFKPETFRGIEAFDKAEWWISESEREGVGVPLVHKFQEVALGGESDLKELLERDIAILKRCQPAPDRLADRVDLFPLPGVTPGTCGVIAGGPISGLASGTALICGDAIATLEHLERGMVLTGAADLERAQESLKEAVEIADILVPGRDNWVMNPVRRGF